MRLILFGRKLFYFDLPEKVDGSYWVPFGGDTDEKLINIEAKNDTWVMKSNDETSIVVNNGVVSDLPLKYDAFYTLYRNNAYYILYTTKTFDDSFNTYYIPENAVIRIGNTSEADIYYGIMKLNGIEATLTFQNNRWIFAKKRELSCFLNNSLLEQDQIMLQNGDTIFIYGLKIVLVNKYIMINNPDNIVNLNQAIFQRVLLEDSLKSDMPEIKEKNFYEEKDYYLKSPRISRVIDKKEIPITPPPDPPAIDDTPFIFVLGPMLATASVSLVTFTDLMNKINSNETTLGKSWPQLITIIIMVVSTLLWPILSKKFKNKQARDKEQIRQYKYNQYLNQKANEIMLELKNEEVILNDSFPSYKNAINVILTKNSKLWERKNEQDDFLQVKLGNGDIKSYIDLKYEKQDFSMNEDNLLQRVEGIVDSSKMLHNVPVTYSFAKNKTTAIIGNIGNKSHIFLKSILVQMMSYHSYDELKFVILTNPSNYDFWEQIKLSPYCFNNDKTIRYFASTRDEMFILNKILYEEAKQRSNIEEENKGNNKKAKHVPHYVVITDDVQTAVKYDFFNYILESENDMSFSIIMLEDRISQLPSKCTNFISLGSTTSDVFEISSDSNFHEIFRDELEGDFDIGLCSSVLSNIPIKLNTSNRYLPNSLSFLDMFNVGKVEQLNILSRWKQNNPIKSLKAQVGVDDLQDAIYLDLHEKAHGPHGLIAGMTGSGKSEFIITYILSMAINYSPEEVSFILIDYKGGGLVGAFENQTSGIVLPHLAGKITNLDKAEMNRTLVSIDSELRRRQAVFNEARESSGESTIDIYKYQRLYREGKLKEPVSHLFIISDEFAELKSQQPEFMDNLISTARIGRSLGVHLILATQKPAGVVNDQIWSNSKFRVCLKVQDKSDSNEMLKVPDAAELKQVGRFYLQVGYNEIYLLGQSGWAGAQYYPTDMIKKEYDRSVMFINDVGEVVESLEMDNHKKTVAANGDQLSNIVKYITETAGKEHLLARKMWLEKIPPVIYVNNLINKYSIKVDNNNMIGIVGELDDPNNQLQNILTIPLSESGNSLFYSINGSDKDRALRSIIYSTSCMYSPDDINWYIIDYGAETMRMFSKFPHVGDILFNGEKEKLVNLFKMIDEEIEKRKTLFNPYDGSYLQYIKMSGSRVPLIGIVINDFDTLDESDNEFQDFVTQYTRDCERYGIFFIVTCSSYNSMRSKLRQCFDHVFALEMNSKDDYTAIVGNWKKVCLFNYPGRGLAKMDEIYEFQTASLFPEETFQTYMNNFVESIKQKYKTKARRIPILPDRIGFNLLLDDLKGMNSIPIGMSKDTLSTCILDFSETVGIIIAANELSSTNNIMNVLAKEIKMLNTTRIIVVDPGKAYEGFSNLFDKYMTDNFETFEEDVIGFADQSQANGLNTMLIMVEPGKIKTKIDVKALELTTKKIKARDDIKVLFGESLNSKGLDFDTWYSDISNKKNGLWIGNGLMDQDIIRVSTLDKKMRQELNNSFGWRIKNSSYEVIKLIDVNEEETDE